MRAEQEQLGARHCPLHLARQQPELAKDVLWGARALVDVEARWARHLTDAWEAGQSSLLVGLDVQSDGFEFDAEFLAILLKRHLVVYEVPISYYGRSYGEGKKIKWHHTFLVIWNLVKYRFV